MVSWVTGVPGRGEGSIRCWASLTAPLGSWLWVAVVGRGCGTRTVERTLAVQGGGGNRATPCEHTSLALDPATSMDPAGPPLPDSRASRLRLPLVKVLVIGNGAREHAIVRALTLDPSVDAVIAAPGNPGIDAIALCRELPQGLLDGEGC